MIPRGGWNDESRGDSLTGDDGGADAKELRGYRERLSYAFRRWLYGSGPSVAVSAPGSPGRVLARATLVVGPLGILSYAIIYVFTARFYTALGVRPEDFKVSYPGFLQEGIIYLAVVALYFGGEVAFFIVAVWFVVAGPGWRRPWGKRAAAITIRFFAVLWATAAIGSVHPRSVGEVVGVSIGLAATPLFLWRAFVGRRGRWFAVLFFAALPALLASSLFLASEDSIDGVRSGHSLKGTYGCIFGHHCGFQVLPWRAEVASMRWIAEQPKSLRVIRFSCVIFLGATDAGNVVYVHDRRGIASTLVIPTDEAVVEINPDDSASCPWRGVLDEIPGIPQPTPVAPGSK
jgi:hypothetical protein